MVKYLREQKKPVCSLAIVLVCAVAAPPGASAEMATAAIVDLPVSFQVRNTNTSGVPCPSDGASYAVRGHITGPREAIMGPGPRTISVYIQGFDEGQWLWRIGVEGYDYSTEMARLGHASLTIDMVGYDASGKPQGEFGCFGSQADVAHQIIGQLRNGTYEAEGAATPSFGRVVLAGNDVGGTIAQIEAYSYNDIDGLVVTIWAEQGFTPYVQTLFAMASVACAAGGENAEGGGPGGYFYLGGPTGEFRQNIVSPNTDPEVVDAALAHRNRNPCGYLPSVLPAIAIDMARLGEIEVPVLLAYPAYDPIITREGREQQAAHFSGSNDVTTAFIDDSSHYMMFARSAPTFRATISEWLSRGFVSAGARSDSPPASAIPPAKKCKHKKKRKGKGRKCGKRGAGKGLKP